MSEERYLREISESLSSIRSSLWNIGWVLALFFIVFQFKACDPTPSATRVYIENASSIGK